MGHFKKVSETMSEKRAEFMKAKKFQNMRTKLNKELVVQGLFANPKRMYFVIILKYDIKGNSAR